MKKILLLAGVATVAGSSFAADWAEVGDAIKLPPGQLTVGVGALDGITGTCDPSDADMFCISITDEASFSATTVGGATWDTQLFLFTMGGMGVAFNDDSTGLQSTLTSTFVSSNGHYLIAISGFDHDADSVGGAIWLDTPFGTERAPDGPGAGSPVSAWSGTGGGGVYRIALTGAEFCAVPEPGTMLAIGAGLAALVARRRRK
jgi:hypothetical protein